MTKERRFHKLWNRLSFYHVYHSSTILPPAFPIPFGAKRLRHQTRVRAGYSSEARIRKGGKDARHCKAMTACPTGAVG